MSEKRDLIELFGLQNYVKPKALYDYDEQDFMKMMPYEISLQMKTLVDKMNECAISGNTSEVILCCSAIQFRAKFLLNLTTNFKSRFQDDE